MYKNELYKWALNCPFDRLKDFFEVAVTAILTVECIDKAFQQNNDLLIDHNDWNDIKDFGYKEYENNG